MQKVITIVMKNGVKYSFGIDKSVSEILNEISACKSEFYTVVGTCAIRVNEISSVEQFEIVENNEVEEDEND